MTVKELKDILDWYLKEVEDRLESDDFLPGLDVQIDAAKDLFDAVVLAAKLAGKVTE